MLTPASQAKTCVAVAKEEKVLAANRAAFHNYHISDKYEAGLVLTGTEVKSAMDGRVQLKEAYISVREGEAWLFNAHISPYSHGNRENHDPMRTRKLLLHKREISRLDEATAKQGMTLVPTQLYLKNGRIKVEVGIARGKKMYDKREAELKRTVERETRAQLKERNR
jgi:SsrA-binding protein